MTKEQPEPSQRSGYIDQWRGISVLMVVANHFVLFKFAHYLEAIHSPHALYRLIWALEMWSAHAGMVGVCVFFVISGYLITQLMLREENKTGAVSLPAFYTRRFCRILPALLSFVLVVSVLGVTGMTPMNEPHDTVVAVSFLCNTVAFECAHQFSQLWTLAIEEQFYLLWPLLLIVAGKFRSRLAFGALAISAVIAVTPQLLVRGWLNNGLAVYCLSSGVLFALSPRFRRWFEITRIVPTWACFIALGVCFSFVVTRWQFLRPVGLLVLAPLIVSTVLARGGQVFPSRLLSSVLEQVGVVSYSLYLWHSIGAWRADHYSSTAFYWWSLLAIPFAWLSYRYIEQPFIRAGHRWSTAVKNFRAARGTQLEH